MYNVKVGQLVIVYWDDICTEAGWHDPAKIELGHANTVGFVSHIRPDALVISSGGMDGALNGDPTIIPWGNITQVYLLEIVD